MGVGAGLSAVSLAAGVAALPLAVGGVGIAVGASYLLSPSWRLAVVIDDTGLAVGTKTKLRFKLAWNEVVAVVASPTTHTCFVDGGAAERSFVVPGDGAPAPYDLADKPALYAEIVARVPPDRIQIVESLAAAARQRRDLA